MFSKKNLYYYFNNNQYYLYTRALTCQYILDNSFDYVLVCISTINSYIVFQYYLVGETDIIKSTKYTSIGYSFPEILCIKSIRKKDKTKMFVFLYLSTDQARYFIFDFNLGSQLKYIYFVDQHCRLEYYGLKINYYKEKDEYILSCIDYNGKILVEFYDKDFKNYNYTFKYIDCETIYGYSILYKKMKKSIMYILM